MKFKINYKKIVLAIISIIILVTLDQISKVFAVQLLKDKEDIILINNALQFHYLENTGAAFSLLTGAQVFFKIITPLLVVVLVFFLVKYSDSRKELPFFILDILLISGAIGNYLDRLHNGYVVDFIYFSLINFPVFNVADIYVTVSVFLFAVVVLFFYKDDTDKSIISAE